MASIPWPPDSISASTATAGAHSSKWATNKDWIKHRALIGELYDSQPLAEVMEFMESEHDFKATVNMYKKRIKQWGLRKNNKDSEMRAIARKTKQRMDRGKASIVHVRDRAIDDEEVARYWKRKGISIDDVIAHRPASATPEAVDFFTPVPSRFATPETFAFPECIFVKIRDYFKGSFESGNWVHGNPRIYCHTRKAQGDSMADLNALFNHSLAACQLLSDHSYQEAGQSLVSATSAVKNILSAEHPQTLGQIFKIVMKMKSYGRHEIALAILRQCSALGQLLMGNEQTLRLICEWLATAEASQFDEIILRCLQSVAEHFESFLGPMHWSALNSRINYVDHVNHARGIGQSGDLLQDLLAQCQFQLGSLDSRTLQVLSALAMQYLEGYHYVEALGVGQDLVAQAQYSQPPEYADFYYVHGLYIVAMSQYGLSETFWAEANLCRAIALRISVWGPHDSKARFWLVILEGWLLEQGQWNSAAEVRERRMGMMNPRELV